MPPRRSAETVERDYQAYELYRQGRSYRQIGAQLGISHQAAFNAVRRAAKDNAVDPIEAAAGRQVFLDRLQDYRDAVRQVLTTTHYVTSPSGRIVEGPDGEPLIDTDPIMRAIDRLRAFDDMELRLRDYYPAAKSRVEVVTEEAALALAAALEAQLADLNATEPGDESGRQPGDPGEDRPST